MPNYLNRQSSVLAACPDLDAVLVCSTGGCFGSNGNAQGYMTFLSGWNSFDSPSVLVLRSGRNPWLLVAHHRMKMMAQDILAHTDIEWVDQNSFGSRIASELRTAEQKVQRVGICGWEEMLAKPWQTICDALAGIEFVDVAIRIASLRAVKDLEQIRTHEKVAGICDEMFERLAEMDVVGKYTYETKAELEKHAKVNGCEFVQHWMTVGESPDYPRYYHYENRQVPQLGDTVVYGMMITLDGVWGHAVRSYFVGEPDDRQRYLQSEVVGFQRKVVESMLPGRELGEIVKQSLADAESVKRVMGDPSAEMLRLGHGIGYSYAEPVISDPFPRSYCTAAEEKGRLNKVTLASGMLFEVHPIFLFKGGAIGVGDMVLVEEGGARFLTHAPRELRGLNA